MANDMVTATLTLAGPPPTKPAWDSLLLCVNGDGRLQHSDELLHIPLICPSCTLTRWHSRSSQSLPHSLGICRFVRFLNFARVPSHLIRTTQHPLRHKARHEL
jgi:hypothetical protein